ncbi:hypothetical protein HH303_07170 [Rhodospirillaceae bacterium KN72]|uniref:Uncharacterized protein n=1 Tax=Pacificispira spongiicola TaxID=2729598 RepID=A0A7Y0DZ30_9PROT|nr:hypothetical protein [Pacificispira spongiicola]NMM44252.1 hypothetical protein [Pacificispira spongiicola]
MADCMTITGLILNLAGVLLLFRYGMPFRVSSDDGERVVVPAGPETKKLDKRYEVIGYIGLAAIVIGTLLQIFAVLGVK